MKKIVALAMAAMLVFGKAAQAQVMPSTSATTTYHHALVDGIRVFYREAGPKGAPTIVLLHGFPSSSRMFDTLIPLLASHYHLIAPDYPGFGQSESPSPAKYRYTFDHLAETTNRLLEQLNIGRYVLYMQDYGGPVGFRILVQHPDRVSAIVVQNANAYKEGLGPKWAGIAQYWADPKAHTEIFQAFSSLEGAKQRHIAGSPHPERYNPDTWTDEYAILSRPDEQETQADLLYDYQTNVASYPEWQAWLRAHKPPTMVLWGKYDVSFIVPGAEAYRRDVPEAEVHILDAGHFALDEKVDEIADLMLRFLSKQKL
ncbi:alpha/beta hydrolase [Bradyrhizobium sp. 33ap4]|uniref:alpha/beta fold hydrolase n=1 Tax=Bradyrhizobium sp. 33ap4 TaxID=3061630 RepID=UPI00292E21B9|nr:alpha/beta hydrolase [Bradyrhizobium sp. 33ap4]